MLKRVTDRLIRQGFDEITINIHHFGDQIVDFVDSDESLFNRVVFSDETEKLLDTGGGILHAERMLGNDSRPFLVHNVDILSNADLSELMRLHELSGRHVTLLVSERESDRKLVFDHDMNLKGWLNKRNGAVRPEGFKFEVSDKMYSFSGIYVLSPRIFGIMKSNGFKGTFPIMDFFLSGVPELRIGGVVQDGLELIDIGKPDTLHRAELRIQ